MAVRIILGAALVTLVVAMFVTASHPGALRYALLAAAVLFALWLSAFPSPVFRPPAAAGPLEDSADRSTGMQLDHILDALPVGVLTIGPDGRIGVFNTAAGEIFGVSAPRVRGRALIEIVRNSELDRRVGATLRDGSSETIEITHSGATERRLHVITRPLEEDRRKGALVIVADQTRMRELETLRREFVSNVSHELRTPLTAVKLMVETLQSGVDQPARDQFLSSIANETDRMIALVEDLLDLARLESGKLELRLSVVDVAQLCRRAVQAYGHTAESAGVALNSSLPDSPLMVRADRDKIYQVLTNLLDNAVRHTRAPGNVTLAAAANDGWITLAVADSGAGIPSSALPHIFERFYVVDPARTRGHSGTGLGLAIVKHIIEAHGGTVTAESELGVGSTFRCALPVGLQTSEAVL